ncbi:MAG: hypothetical protein AAFW81_08015 [Pseudomonadota bacterium]
MKVLLMSAVLASLLGASKIDVTIKPDGHFAAVDCAPVDDLASAYHPYAIDTLLCEAKYAMRYDSLACLWANTEIAWRKD